MRMRQAANACRVIVLGEGGDHWPARNSRRALAVNPSARVTTSTSGGMVKHKGRIWDRKGDGWHARIYGYSLGHPFGIRKATRGSSRTFSGEVPAPLFFEVCTYNRNTEITCTRRWTHN
jgi:hypothetical protein